MHQIYESMKARGKIAVAGIAVLFALAVLIVSCYLIVSFNASDRIFDDINDIPHNKAGLLLATSPISQRCSQLLL